MRRILKILLLPLVISVVAIVLFFSIAAIPQGAIKENSLSAAKQMFNHQPGETVINYGDLTYAFDNHTDALILMQSYNMTIEDPLSILKNPQHKSEKEPYLPAIALHEIVTDQATNETNYVRYWMGFRLIVRPLLMLGDYYTIRKIVAFFFWSLLISVMALLGKRCGILSGICFGVAFSLINPAIVSQSLQFSCCFILCFIFMSILLIFENKKLNIPLLFCSFGALTQFFDFYTTPLITLLFPLLVLLLLNQASNSRWGTFLKTLSAWLYGYVSMWIIKLTYVTLFTDINGFENGFTSFFSRIGITVAEDLKEYYDAKQALTLVWNNVFSESFGPLALFLLILITACAILISFFTQSRKEFFSSCVYLGVAILPIIWFALTAQPIVIHHWFQYRTIVVFFGALFLYWGHSFSNLPQLIKRKMT